MNAAERLFARKGFHAVSVRDITRTARADVSLISYHFGSKQKLFAAVLERRAKMLNAARAAALEEALRNSAPGQPSAEEILHAFVDPILMYSTDADEGWQSYFALIAQVNNSREWAQTFMNRHFNALVSKFIEALREALPEISEADLYWGYHFLSGALTLTFAQTGRIDVLSGGVCRSTDLGAVYARFAPFFAGGFETLMRRGKNGALRAPRAKPAAVPVAAPRDTAKPASGSARKASTQA